MAKRTTDSKDTVSTLIISKPEFKKQLEDRINIGKELLDTAVKTVNSSLYYGRRQQSIEYDEKEKEDFFSAYHKWDDFNTDFLKRTFNNSENEYKKEYEAAYHLGNIFGSDDVVGDQKKTIKQKIGKLESIIERLVIIPCDKQEEIIDTHNSTQLSNKVFIVHGHDSLMKETTARTLSKLGLDPIILHEQPDGGRTIIEKFEENSSEVGYAIILLTADDEGKAKKETDMKARARQNVVFEMGYFIGKLGRKKVLLLLENGVEKPGDLDGVVYTPIDANDGWKLKLVKELKACKYNVSADNI